MNEIFDYSDGEGFTNEEECNVNPLTNPGDSDSYPEPKGTRNFNITLVVGVVITLIVGIFRIWRK